MPQSHRQTKPDSNPVPRSKPHCPHCRLPELPGCNLPLSTPPPRRWPRGTAAGGPAWPQSRCTQLHRVQGMGDGWDPPARSAKVMRTGLPAQADRQSHGERPPKTRGGEGGSSPACWAGRPSFSDLDLCWGFNYSLSLRRLPRWPSRTATEMKLSLQMAHSVCQEISSSQTIIS
uniref:Uncharacterized protein n=1 Tax=Myotis myotis TaxID=51298 RepID=A0A7J7T5W2_MYOMY|nr:hypothetical protein mMyoMyo1_009207 [Myotis myotis]